MSLSGRILLVDDEADIRIAYGRVLRQAGYHVTTAESGALARALLSTEQFDAVVSDIGLTDMTGIDLLTSIRERDADMPVVFVTGQAALDTALQAIERGVFRYLVKPVDPVTLTVAVGKAVFVRRMARVRRNVNDVLGMEERGRLERSFDNTLRTLWTAFQPIVRRDGSLFGYEALLRSDEPALPHPGAVLDAAEQLGRLDEVGRTVRSRAAGSFQEVPPPVDLFVNLHTRDLHDPDLVAPDAPLAAIAHRVVLEITERASLDEVPDVRARVAALRKLGFRIAIDDLGAGYAGLTSFALLEPEVVKIDMGLVRDVDKQPLKHRLIASITAVCKDFGTLVVAEGVETREEYEALCEAGCNHFQGYFFGKPARLPSPPAS